MPFNPPAKNAMLDALSAITHVGIGNLTDPGTGTNYAGTEATGGTPAYARQAVTWGSASGELKQNTNALTFDLPPGTWGFVLYFTASTGNTNTYRGYAPINGGTARGFAAVDTALTNDAFLSPGHGLANGDRVQLFNVLATTLATGLTEGTVYYVVNATTDSFKVSASSGGAAVDVTALGGGEIYFEKVVPEIYASQGQLTIAIGAITHDLTGI